MLCSGKSRWQKSKGQVSKRVRVGGVLGEVAVAAVVVAAVEVRGGSRGGFRCIDGSRG